MDRRTLKRLDDELREYLASMVDGFGRSETRASMVAYVTGLLLDGERKSIQPIAARLVDEASEVEAMRQRLQECVVISPWMDDEMFRRLARKVDHDLPAIEALVIDDTGFPKKGKHSVGVARQYSGTLGRIDNCQVAVSLHLAGEQGSACIAMRLYLSEEWATDAAKRTKAGIPSDVRFEEKWRLALAQIERALADGVRKHVVLADPGYGDCGDFREGLAERQLQYVVGIKGDTSVWPPGSKPKLRGRRPGQPGRDATRHYDDAHPPILVNKLAQKLKFRSVSWREGSRGRQSSRFAAVRVRTAHRHMNGVPPGEEQWLLCQWLEGERSPTKFWLSTLPAHTSVRTLVRMAKLRWRVERDYQEMKQELGLDHFEGRTWRGFHHHATLCAVAHGFLALRRALSPPEQGEVDAASSSSPASASLAALDRDLPPMPAPGGRHKPAARSLAHVIR